MRPAVSLMLLFAVDACAWVYPEHRDIALLSLQRLDPAQRALLEKLWSFRAVAIRHWPRTRLP